MTGILIGYGSIGKRHYSNLKELGHECVIVDLEDIPKIDDILNGESFDFGIVSTPNDSHINYSIKLANKGIPFFCEKPLYHPNQIKDTEELNQLIQICTESNLVNMVGCNMRFTDEVEHLPNKTPYVNVYFGYNLKKWRPTQNHLESYSSNKEMGGGIFFDAIHELDYLYYKFGKIKSIQTNKYKFTDITNDTEDISVSRITFESGTIADVHLNYLSDRYTRYYEYIQDDTLHRVDFVIKNDMYIEEIKYFMNCVLNKNQTFNTVENATYLINKMKESYE
jgi:predicted dehydrogenase